MVGPNAQLTEFNAVLGAVQHHHRLGPASGLECHEVRIMDVPACPAAPA